MASLAPLAVQPAEHPEARSLAIGNPVAGHGAAAAVCRELSREHPAMAIHLTSGVGEACAVARDAVRTGFRTVVAVGGDGTLAEVVNGVLEADTAGDVVVGFIPSGTCNDFARVRPPMPSASLLMRQGRERRLDVGRVTYTTADGVKSRYFIVNCTAGFISAGIARFVSPGRLGRLLRHAGMTAVNAAYGLHSVLTFPPVTARVFLDEHAPREVSVANIAILKVPYFAGGIDLGSTVRPDDGRLEVAAILACGRPQLLRLAWCCLRGTAAGNRAVRAWSVRRVRIEMPSTVPLEVDGEIVGSTPAEFEVLPRRLRLLS